MHGFGHIEIPTTDVLKAQKFFGKVFGWTFTYNPDLDYTFFQTPDGQDGGFEVMKKIPKKAQTNLYIEVENIDAKLKDIRKAKGKVELKKSPVGNMGWRAMFTTPDGCYLHLWQRSNRGG